MELVVDDPSFRGVALLESGFAECLPHVHNGQADLPAFLRAEPGKELVHACFGAVLAPEPDRPTADQVAHDDSVTVPPADRNLVDADDRRGGRPGTTELLSHVFDLQCLDRFPVQAEFASYIPNSRGPTAPPHVEGKAFGVKRIVGQPAQRLLLHGAAAPAGHAPDLELQVHPSVATGEIAHAADLVIVERSPNSPAGPTCRFFPRRTRRTRRALGSPKRPRTTRSGRNPGKQYASSSRRFFRIRSSCQFIRLKGKPENPSNPGTPKRSDAFFHPHALEKSRFLFWVAHVYTGGKPGRDLIRRCRTSGGTEPRRDFLARERGRQADRALAL